MTYHMQTRLVGSMITIMLGPIPYLPTLETEGMVRLLPALTPEKSSALPITSSPRNRDSPDASTTDRRTSTRLPQQQQEGVSDL